MKLLNKEQLCDGVSVIYFKTCGIRYNILNYVVLVDWENKQARADLSHDQS